MRTLLIPLAMIALLCACSRQPQPVVEAVKPLQESVEKAKSVEQTIQNAADARQAATKE